MAKGNRQVKYSDDRLAEALDAAQGSVKDACETLNMNRRAMQYRIYGNKQRDTPGSDMLREIVETWKEIKVKDLEESVINRAFESDTLAIFTLKAQAGWKDGREITLSGPNGGAIPIAVVQQSVWEKVNGPSGGSSK